MFAHGVGDSALEIRAAMERGVTEGTHPFVPKRSRLFHVFGPQGIAHALLPTGMAPDHEVAEPSSVIVPEMVTAVLCVHAQGKT